MRSKTLYVEQEIEYDITFKDILELIETCDNQELELIKKRIGFDGVDENPCENINDDLKFKLLKFAFNKYEIEDLMKKLDIKYNEF
mgnify:CR=1 FL=1